MRRIAGCCCLVLLAGCGSAGQATAPGTPEPPRAMDVGTDAETPFTLTVRREANIASATLAAPAEKLWPALVMVFDTLGLPVTTSDPTARILVSSSGKRTTSIDGQRVSRYFECPATGYGNSANSQDTYIVVQVQLLAAEAGTELRMQTQGYVVMNGTRVQCRSTTRLEQRITDAVARKVGLTG